MRLIAQWSMGLIAFSLAAMWKYSLVLVFFWPFFLVAITPIAWYVVFDRHREAPHEDVLLKLDAIANALNARGDIAATGSSSRR